MMACDWCRELMSNGPSSQTGLRELVLAKKLNSVDRSDWIAVSEISVPVGSKGELNHRSDHRSDHRANNRINRRAYHHWMNNRRLVDHTGGDPGTEIGAAHTGLLWL